jgi:putative transposase
MNQMSRLALPGSTIFFSVMLQNRGSDLLIRHVAALRTAVSTVRRRHPFRIDAFVVLPDHLHAILTLPPGDTNHGLRWRRIKAEFARQIGERPQQRASHITKGESGIWQRGFWDHVIRNPEDMDLHLAYCWADPVRHGLVRRAQDWEASSIHRDLRDGRLPDDWYPTMVTGAFGERRDDTDSVIAWDTSHATHRPTLGAALH